MAEIPVVTGITKQPTTTTGAKVQGLGSIDRSGGLILDGKKFDARIEDSITNASLERTIDGASILSITVEDPERFLTRGGYFKRRGELLFDDLWFRMCALDKQGDAFTMTFEDQAVSLLRRHTSPLKASRNDVTRAEFAARLVHQVPHLRFVCPQLHKKQPIADLPVRDRLKLEQQADTERQKGIPSQANLKIKSSTATPAQKRVIVKIMRVAEALNAGPRATLAMVVAAIGESTMGGDPNTYRPNSAGYWGVFQGGSGHNGSARNFPDAHDTEGMAQSFLLGGKGFQQGGAIALAKANPTMDVGDIATRVEASGKPGAFYGKYADEGRKIIAAWGGADLSPRDQGSAVWDAARVAIEKSEGLFSDWIQDDEGNIGKQYTETYVQRYEFSRGLPGGQLGEDSWTCINRLAKQVHWRCFIVAGVVYFISDYDLIRSRPRMTIGEYTKGVDNIDFSLDSSLKKPDTVTIDCRAERWAAPPGTVVVLDQDLGPAHGAWIVADVIRPDISDQATMITLTRATVPLPEPASTVATSQTKTTQDGGQSTDVDGDTVPGRKAKLKDNGHAVAPAAAPSKVKAMIRAGNEIVGVKYGPGQHAASSSGDHPEYDCSSSIAHILLAAGLVTEGVNYVSGTFAQMYKSGPGDWVTIGANGGHVWMKVAGLVWNTHGDGPVSGIGWHKTNASASTGFAIRHPSGL